MEILYDISVVVIGVSAYNLIHTIIDVIYKISQRVKFGVPRMDNPPKPPKSFKERLAEKALIKHHGLHQPDNELDTSNPPTETGT